MTGSFFDVANSHGVPASPRVSHLTVPFVILIALVNPVFEEAIESGYFFHALQRYGPWVNHICSGSLSRFSPCDDGFKRVRHDVCDGLALWMCLLEVASIMAADPRNIPANVLIVTSHRLSTGVEANQHSTGEQARF